MDRDSVSANVSLTHLKHGTWNKTRRWAVSLALFVAMITYYVYTPIPPGVSEPWKARQVMALLRTIGHVSYFTEKIGVANRFNTTRFIIDNLSMIPPKNYTNLEVVDTTFDGVNVRVYMPLYRRDRGPAVVFYHGGGWFMGSVESHDHMTTALAQKLQVVVVSVEYRLCPENPYPAPLEDCLRATRYFMDNAYKYHVDRTRIAIAGDSAGGTLAAAAILKLQHEADAQPRGSPTYLPRLQVLIYPLLQGGTFDLPSYLHNDGAVLGTSYELANVFLLYIGLGEKQTAALLANSLVTADLRQEMNAKINVNKLPSRYLQGYKKRLEQGLNKVSGAGILNIKSVTAADVGSVDNLSVRKVSAALRDPYCMPLMATDGQLMNIPETLVVTAEYDMLRDEGIIYAKRLEEAGVAVTWRNYEHSYHGMLAFFDEPLKTEEGERMMDEIVGFLQQKL